MVQSEKKSLAFFCKALELNEKGLWVRKKKPTEVRGKVGKKPSRNPIDSLPSIGTGGPWPVFQRQATLKDHVEC